MIFSCIVLWAVVFNIYYGMYQDIKKKKNIKRKASV